VLQRAHVRIDSNVRPDDVAHQLGVPAGARMVRGRPATAVAGLCTADLFSLLTIQRQINGRGVAHSSCAQTGRTDRGGRHQTVCAHTAAVSPCAHRAQALALGGVAPLGLQQRPQPLERPHPARMLAQLGVSCAVPGAERGVRGGAAYNHPDESCAML
jgi:hypothetical protein